MVRAVGRTSAVVVAALAAVVASSAHAQFVLSNGSGFVESLLNVSGGGYFASDYDLKNLAFPGPAGGWVSTDIAAGGTSVSADALLTGSLSPRLVSCHHLNKRVATWGKLNWGFDTWAKGNATMNFSMVQANTSVLVIATGRAVHQEASPLPGSVGHVIGKLTLKRTGQTPIVDFNYNLAAPGSTSDVYVSHAVLPIGTYNLTVSSATNGDPMTGEVELAVDLIAGCSTQEVSYALPAKGVPIEVTLDISGTQLNKSIAVTGTIAGTVVMDCSNHPMALHLESIHLQPVDDPVVWDLPLGMSLVASGITMDADTATGELGPPAPVANNCCGTLVGVSPVVSGSAVLTAADGATYPMSFNDLFEPSFAGIPFTLGGFSDASTLALGLGFTGTIDLGFGEGNPTIVSAGTITADGHTCPLGDLDCDLLVGPSDLAILLGNWSLGAGQPGCGGSVPCPADLDFDGVVGSADLAILLGAWTTG